MMLEIHVLGTREGGSRSPQRDGKKNRGAAAHLYPSSSEKPIHPRFLIFKRLPKTFVTGLRSRYHIYFNGGFSGSTAPWLSSAVLGDSSV